MLNTFRDSLDFRRQTAVGIELILVVKDSTSISKLQTNWPPKRAQINLHTLTAPLFQQKRLGHH